VVPSEDELKRLGIAKTLEEIADWTPEQFAPLKKLLIDDFLSIATVSNLPRVAVLNNIVIATEDWTPENGMLTAAMKLNRIPVLKFFKDEIDLLYPEE
jgi:long-subunit acyl-CoA synthetase (AMP-forming)